MRCSFLGTNETSRGFAALGSLASPLKRMPVVCYARLLRALAELAKPLDKPDDEWEKVNRVELRAVFARLDLRAKRAGLLFLLKLREKRLASLIKRVGFRVVFGLVAFGFRHVTTL